MADEDAVAGLLSDIAADPDDDAVCLIFADWLDEHGDPRGEFLRIGCTLNRLAANDPRRGDLELRANTVLAQYRNAWGGDPPPGIAVRLERVFLRVQTDVATLNRWQGRQWWRRQQAWVAHLLLAPCNDVDLLGLVGAGMLDRLSGLTLGNTSVTDAGMAYLSRLTRLRTLDLGCTRVTDRGLHRLAGLRELRTLDLSHTRVTGQGLLGLTVLRQLKRLSLWGVHPGRAALEGLRRALPQLTIVR